MKTCGSTQNTDFKVVLSRNFGYCTGHEVGIKVTLAIKVTYLGLKFRW